MPAQVEKLVARVALPAMIVQWGIGEVPWMERRSALVGSRCALVTLVAVYLSVRLAVGATTRAPHPGT